MKKTLSITALLALAACGSTPPAPDWQMHAHGSLARANAAYMAGRDLVEKTEFERAREQIGSTGKVELAIRAELGRCASRVAALVFEACPGFEKLSRDAAPADLAYAAYLAGQTQTADVALLPEQHRAVAGAGSDTAAAAAVQAIADPLSKLVAAGAVFRANRATPELLAAAADTASAQGWRRPLLAWLNVQALRADKAGAVDEAERLRRRMVLAAGADK